MDFKALDIKARLANFARIKADDDMKIIIENYAENMQLAPENMLKEAKFYRKRARNHKLRGKS